MSRVGNRCEKRRPACRSACKRDCWRQRRPLFRLRGNFPQDAFQLRVRLDFGRFRCSCPLHLVRNSTWISARAAIETELGADIAETLISPVDLVIPRRVVAFAIRRRLWSLGAILPRMATGLCLSPFASTCSSDNGLACEVFREFSREIRAIVLVIEAGPFRSVSPMPEGSARSREDGFASH